MELISSAVSSVRGSTLAVRGTRREDRAAPSPSFSLAPRPLGILADQVPNVGPAKAVGAREPSFGRAEFRNLGTYRWVLSGLV